MGSFSGTASWLNLARDWMLTASDILLIGRVVHLRFDVAEMFWSGFYSMVLRPLYLSVS
jgi:hypothetical protein